VAKTPEGLPKDEIRKLLDSYGSRIFHRWPVRAGYGDREVDCYLCFKGMFVCIEVKRPGGYAKKFQEAIIEEVRDANGHAVCVDNVDDVKKLLDYIEKSF
jgi:hypothetical protein